jgi:hypothetical protein
MKTGMLWFDNSSRSLKEKVEAAVLYYQEKYGQAPTMCFVNPATLAGKEGPSNGVEVRSAQTVMPDHFWIGVGKEGSSKGHANSKAG